MAEDVSQSPQTSLPKQAGGWAEVKAYYRFLDHDRIDPQQIGQAHRKQVYQAMAAHPRILLVQDDTDLQAVKIDGGKHVQHSTLAVTPDGSVLGVLQQAWFTRTKPAEGETRLQRHSRWRESCVWPDAARAIGHAPSDCRWIHVADRASDDLAFMSACEEMGHGFVIRARHDRRVDGATDKLWSRMEGVKEKGKLTVTVGAQRDASGRVTRRQRKATVAVAVATVQLEQPWNHPGDVGPRTVQAIHLREVDPPEDVEAIDWMLLTSEPVDSFADACRIVRDYEIRWVIEEWHRVLKEGCRLEASQLEKIENLQRLAAILSIVAVRLLQLRDLTDPDRSPQTADDAGALQRTCPAMWIEIVAALAEEDPQTLTPRLFFLTIAKQGGYLARTSDGRPGWKTVWRGWYDIVQMVRGATLLQKITAQAKRYG